jgi:hypothetical protein
MRRLFVSGVAIFSLCFASYCSSAPDAQQNERVAGWRSDIDTLLFRMARQHYVYRSKPLPNQLIEKARLLKKKIGQYSDERMMVELARLMWYMHDGHSYVVPVATKSTSFYLPIQIYFFSDGAYIIDADQPYKELIGDKVLKINGVTTDKLLSDMNSYVQQDNKYTVIWFAPSVLRFRGIYESYGLAAGSPAVSIDVISQNGEAIGKKVPFVPVSEFYIPKLIPSQLAGSAPAPLYLSDVEDNFWFTQLRSAKKTIYFQFNQIEDKSNETLASFGKRFGDLLQNTKPDLLIIDVRHNGGGDATLIQPLLNGIINFEHNSPAARIVVLTGRNTFSAAQIFISLMNRDTKALFAGEPSSSKPNFVGEVNYSILPWSGATVSISNRYHESIPGDTREWIAPDFPVSLSSKQYFQNQDPVLDFILNKFGR